MPKHHYPPKLDNYVRGSSKWGWSGFVVCMAFVAFMMSSTARTGHELVYALIAWIIVLALVVFRSASRVADEVRALRQDLAEREARDRAARLVAAADVLDKQQAMDDAGRKHGSEKSA